MKTTEVVPEILKLSQLKTREGWEHYSLDNICELAEKASFGLYFNICQVTGSSNTKTSNCIDEYVKLLVSSNTIEESERNIYLDLSKKFKFLCKEFDFLLKDLDGYARLAMPIEVEIFQLCHHGSIKNFRREFRLLGSEYNNYFGFKRSNGKCISPAYYFPSKCIEEQHLVVLGKQITEFEQRRPSRLSRLSSSNAKNSFIESGDCYEITFNGVSLKPLKKIKGLQYLALLLKKPHTAFSVNSLYLHCNLAFPEVIKVEKELHELQQSNDTTQPDKIYDKDTLKSLRNRLADLEEEIEEAKDLGDIDKKEELQNEKSKIIKYIDGGSYKNKVRNFATDTEKKRSTVTLAIKAAIKKIGEHSLELQKHLEDSIKTGTECVYKPAQVSEW